MLSIFWGFIFRGLMSSFCKFKCTSNIYLINYSNSRTCTEIALELGNFLSAQMSIVSIANEIAKGEVWKL